MSICAFVQATFTADGKHSSWTTNSHDQTTSPPKICEVILQLASGGRNLVAKY